MATQTITELIDDVDGSPAEETLTFGVDGALWEIDLNAENAEQLRQALDRFIAHGRRTSTVSSTLRPDPRHKPARATRPGYTGYSNDERQAMQVFAEANGLRPPGERGRIAAVVSEAWEAAGRPEL